MKVLLIGLVFSFFVSCAKQNVSKIHQQAIVIDTHTDTPMQLVNKGLDLSVRHNAPDSRVDYPRLREGAVDAIFFALFTGQRERTIENYDNSYRLAHQMIDSTLASIQKNTSLVQLATKAGEISSISASQKTAIFLGMENGFPLAKNIERIKEFYDRGVRYITLSHTANNDICDSSTDFGGAEHNGLSVFGEKVVEEMNRLGMIIDVSHISDKAFFDVLEKTKAPVIASHSSVRSICKHKRNMSDEMIQALAKNGGVLQICILGDYIRDADTTSLNFIKMEELRLKYNNWKYNNDEERKMAWSEWDSINRYYPPVLPSIADAVDHIDYVVKLVGVDYVGIGSDFDGGGGLSDCFDVADFPKITNELVRRGYKKEDISKIWGGNFMRVFNEVEQLAN